MGWEFRPRNSVTERPLWFYGWFETYVNSYSHAWVTGSPPEGEGDDSKKHASCSQLAACFGVYVDSRVLLPGQAFIPSLLQLHRAKPDASLCKNGDSQEGGSESAGLRIVI